MTIHQGLVGVQADILKVIANLVDTFHIKVTTLSAPQVHALVDHMCARCAGSHSFLAAIRWGTKLTRPESFLQSGPTQLLESFDRLPGHQTDIKRGLVYPIQLEGKIDHFSKALQTHMVDSTSVPALMLNFKSKIRGILTMDLTGEKAILHYPLLRGNIAQDLKENLDAPTTAPGHSSHQHAVHDESWPLHTVSGGDPTVPSTSVFRIPTDSLIINKKGFSPKPIDRVKALISTENRTQILIKVGTE